MFTAAPSVPKQSVEIETLPPGSIGIGIETEFLLRFRNPTKLNEAKNLRGFSCQVASGYLEYMKDSRTLHPRMHQCGPRAL